MAEEAADPLELGLGVVHQPREENGQDVLESVGVEKWLQLHGVPAVIDQLGMPLDGLVHVRP